MTDAAALARMIRQLPHQGRPPIAAIDGMAASGKTTLCAALTKEIPGAHVVHMDDFFLPPERRHEREETLANADVARFYREVLSPLVKGKEAVYRPYRCHPDPGFLAPISISPSCPAVIVEGAYCLHPMLFDAYDLRVLSLISPDAQRARILRRNGEDMLSRFLEEWIPLENRHILIHRLKETCDLILTTP